MKQADINFLNDNRYIWDMQQVGCYAHLSDVKINRFNEIAKSIQPDISFQLKECQDCINDLVKFVYTKFDRKGKAVRMKFPKEVSDAPNENI